MPRTFIDAKSGPDKYDPDYIYSTGKYAKAKTINKDAKKTNKKTKVSNKGK